MTDKPADPVSEIPSNEGSPGEHVPANESETSHYDPRRARAIEALNDPNNFDPVWRRPSVTEPSGSTVPGRLTVANETLTGPQSGIENLEAGDIANQATDLIAQSHDNSSEHSSEQSSEHSADENQPPPTIQSVSLQPTILDPLPHMTPLTPHIVDESALSEISEPSQYTHRPVFRKLGSRRPPPTSPPEPISYEQLSMPTLPSLHLTSIPVLIERYREERRLNPEGFDKDTMAIKKKLLEAKIERGGVDHLLPNEYTAELASRLDAETIESWARIRQHDQEVCIESDDEDEDLAATDLGHFNAQANAEAAAATVEGAKDVNKPDNSVQDRSLGQITVPAGLTIPVAVGHPTPDPEYTRLASYVRQNATSGNVTHTSNIVKETLPDGSERYTHESYIKVTKTIDVPRGSANLPTAALPAVDTAATGVHPDVELPLEEVIASALTMRGEDDEGLPEELKEELEEVKKRLGEVEE